MESQRVAHNWVTKYSTAYTHTRAHTHTYTTYWFCVSGEPWIHRPRGDTDLFSAHTRKCQFVVAVHQTWVSQESQPGYWKTHGLWNQIFHCLQHDLIQVNRSIRSLPLPLPFVITSSLQILAFYHHLIYVQHFLYYPGFTVIPVFKDEYIWAILENYQKWFIKIIVLSYLLCYLFLIRCMLDPLAPFSMSLLSFISHLRSSNHVSWCVSCLRLL